MSGILFDFVDENVGSGDPTGAASGDLSGVYPNPNVAKLSGATVPAGGGLTTGNILIVSGASALSYAALDLTNTHSVSGILPVVNLPSATTSTKGLVELTGDLGGTATAPTVLKINGTTVPAGGALTTGNILKVSGAGAISYGALDLTNSSSVSGILPTTNLPSANNSTSGIVTLTGDLGGTATAPVVIALTGSGGIVTANSQLQNTTLANNSATVLRGELIRTTKTVSLIQGGTGNTDTTIWQTPAKFRLLHCFLRIASSITLGALTTATVSLGKTVGGVELIAAYSLLGTETTSTAPIGLGTAQLGSDLIAGNAFGNMYIAATTLSLRAAVVAGSITTGSVEVQIVGYQF